MILVFLADGFEEAEALIPVDVLKRCGFTVKTVSIMDSKTVTGRSGISVVADEHYQDFKAEDFEAVILPGGLPGADHLQNSSYVKEAVLKAQDDGKVIAAICAAPKALGAFGVLNGKNATCYPGFEDELIGAKKKNCGVVADGNIITGKAAGKSFDFAFKIAEVLGKSVDAEEVKKSIFY